MKKSELKQLIREEIKNALEGVNDDIEAKFSKMVMGDKPKTSGPGNRMMFSLETLPGYTDLAATRKEADMIGGPKISLPSIDDSNSYTTIFSKADAQEWVDGFTRKFGINPGQTKIKFAMDTIGRPEVINSDKFKEWKRKGEAAIQSFYDKSEYTGD